MKQKDSNGKFIICVEIGDGTKFKNHHVFVLPCMMKKFGAQCPSAIVQRQLNKASEKDIYTLQGLC
jgi:hypothetical protein